jgi:hypothetical protein
MRTLALIMALCGGLAGSAGATQVCTFEPPASPPGAPVNLITTTKALCGELVFDQFQLTEAGSAFSRSNPLFLSGSTFNTSGDLILHLDPLAQTQDLILRFHLTGTNTAVGASGLSSLATAVCAGVVCTADVSVRLDTLGPGNSLNLTQYLSNLGSDLGAAALAQSYGAGSPYDQPVSSQPEPASMLLLAGGLAAIGALRRRIRQAG